jgi:S-adenosylhomocysteine hydrolase
MPAINVNDSVTKSKFDNNTVVKNLQLMQFVVQLILCLLVKELLCGYGDVGKGTAFLEVLDLLLQLLKSIQFCTSCNGRF